MLPAHARVTVQTYRPRQARVARVAPTQTPPSVRHDDGDAQPRQGAKDISRSSMLLWDSFDRLGSFPSAPSVCVHFHAGCRQAPAVSGAAPIRPGAASPLTIYSIRPEAPVGTCSQALSEASGGARVLSNSPSNSPQGRSRTGPWQPGPPGIIAAPRHHPTLDERPWSNHRCDLVTALTSVTLTRARASSKRSLERSFRNEPLPLPAARALDSHRIVTCTRRDCR